MANKYQLHLSKLEATHLNFALWLIENLPQFEFNTQITYLNAISYELTKLIRKCLEKDNPVEDLWAAEEEEEEK